MKLEINEKYIDNEYAKFFASWTRQEFQGYLSNVKVGRVKKDGHFYKRDTHNFEVWVCKMYEVLRSRFAVDEKALSDELDTVIRMLYTLTAEKYIAFIEVAFEPYTNLEDNVSISFW